LHEDLATIGAVNAPSAPPAAPPAAKTAAKALTLTIDGRQVTVPEGTSIWDAARGLGIPIPVLCHDPRLRPVGVCRMCVVEVQGARTLQASCVRPCEAGMDVKTQSPVVERNRAMLADLLLRDHPTPCARETSTGDCDLEALGRRYALLGDRGGASAPLAGAATLARGNGRPTDASSPVIAVDHQACILCDRCIRACDEVQNNDVIGRTGKGYEARIAFDLDVPMGKSTCVACGECAAVCPTGALTNTALTVPATAKKALKAVDSVCPYCGVGCALTYHVDEEANRVVFASGRAQAGSQERLCVKGRYGFDYTTHPQRLTRPLIRKASSYPKGALSRDVRGEGDGRRRAGGPVDYAEILPHFREATWEEALSLAASRLSGIRAAHGPGALAGFGSAKCTNEEAYLFQKLVRAGWGTNNVDHCTRLCHASSVAALFEGIGTAAVTTTYGDVVNSEVALLTGTNSASNHPVAASFFKEAARHGTKLIVVDPRETDIAAHAWRFLKIKPGSDVSLYNGIMHVILARGLEDVAFVRDRTENVEALKATVARYPPEVASRTCGIAPDTIVEVALEMARARSMIVFWGMGISQHVHGTDNARCLIALCLLTGNVGKPGAGLHPLRGQNNVQGASDSGLIPMFYPDYQRVEDPAVRAKFERAWGVPLDPKRGLTVVEIMKAALEHRVRGMYMLGENPFLSDPNVNKVRRALSALEFLVVQDIFLTETCEFADVVLPASSALEKTGTYTNTDRRVQVGRPALRMPGESRLDWEVLCDLSNRMGYPMPYASPEEVFLELAALGDSLTGLDYAKLAPSGKLYPCPDPENTDGTVVMYGDRFPTPSGRGKFVPADVVPPDEAVDAEYPFVLNTGRLLEHWHTGSMTRRAKALDAIEPEAFVEIASEDCARLGLRTGDWVRVASRRGEIRTKVRAAKHGTPPGSVFMAFCFREAAANLLTTDALDPVGKIPEFKYCAVKVEKVAPPDAPHGNGRKNGR
jgi:formate dehydrogenase major subunit